MSEQSKNVEKTPFGAVLDVMRLERLRLRLKIEKKKSRKTRREEEKWREEI
jgi:hypothetical protein